MNPKNATVVAGALVGLVAAQSLGVFFREGPSILSPTSMLLIVPAFFGVPHLLVVVVFVGMFWLWCPALFNGEPSVPKRTLVLLVVAAGLSILGFVFGWEYGIKYQGFTYAVTCALISLLLLSSCAVALWRTHKRPSFRGSLLVHTLAFIWLASYAFPYLGETP